MRNILKFIYQVQQVEPEITDALVIGILHLVMMTETSCEYLDCLLKQEGGLFFSFYYRADAGSEHKAVSHRSRVELRAKLQAKIAQSSVNLSSYNYDKLSTVNHLHVLDTYL